MSASPKLASLPYKRLSYIHDNNNRNDDKENTNDAKQLA